VGDADAFARSALPPLSNGGRRQYALDLKPPDANARSPARAESTLQTLEVSRRDLLGGLIHEYELAAV
jgi:hypothetical protein